MYFPINNLLSLNFRINNLLRVYFRINNLLRVFFRVKYFQNTSKTVLIEGDGITEKDSLLSNVFCFRVNSIVFFFHRYFSVEMHMQKLQIYNEELLYHGTTT